jgi:gliding motility-associated transport system permease protein
MRNIWTIARREFKLYFDSPLAYAVALIIFLVDGIIFALTLNSYATQGFGSAPTADIILSPTIFFFIFLAPVLTMRLISDEVRMGTIELLLTAPIRDYEVVVGKWLGAFLFTLVIIGVSLIYPFIFNVYTDPGIDQPLMMSAYLGMILAVGVFLAVGTAMSSLFSNQVASYVAALVAIVMFWWLIGFVGSALPAGGALFNYLDLSSRFDSFQTGLISLSDIVVYLSLIALGLFAGSVIVESRRWRA